MQVLCGLQVVFFLFNCQTPGMKYPQGKGEIRSSGGIFAGDPALIPIQFLS